MSTQFDVDMYKNDQVTRRYSEGFKLKILAELSTGKYSKRQLCLIYGLRASTINGWIKKYDRYEPELNVALDDLANHYGTTIVPARVRSPKEKFLADEKHLLQPLPKTVYEMKFYKEYTVAPNNHICLFKDRHYYSVPYIHVGRKAMMIYTRS